MDGLPLTALTFGVGDIPIESTESELRLAAAPAEDK